MFLINYYCTIKWWQQVIMSLCHWETKTTDTTCTIYKMVCCLTITHSYSHALTQRRLRLSNSASLVIRRLQWSSVKICPLSFQNWPKLHLKSMLHLLLTHLNSGGKGLLKTAARTFVCWIWSFWGKKITSFIHKKMVDRRGFEMLKSIQRWSGLNVFYEVLLTKRTGDPCWCAAVV